MCGFLLFWLSGSTQQQGSQPTAHLCQGPPKNTPGPRTKNLMGRRPIKFLGQAQGCFWKGGPGKDVLQLGRVVVGWSQTAKIVENHTKHYVFEGFLVPSGFDAAGPGG